MGAMRDTRLIFVEGLMGSGKSTTAAFIARQVQRGGLPVRHLPEGGAGHAIRMMGELAHPFQPWRDVTSAQYRARSLGKWRAFAAEARRSAAVTVCDGQLFHGNMTDLLLMDAESAAIRAYVHDILAIVRDLRPALVYLYQDDLERALRTVCAARGRGWTRYQVSWKLRSPYGRRRHLAGFAGLVALYRAYRELTDATVAGLDIATLALENAAGDWPEYRRTILDFLRLPSVDGPDLAWLPAQPGSTKPWRRRFLLSGHVPVILRRPRAS